MPTYIGFSTVNANLPRTSNPRTNGIDYGTTGITSPLIFGKKFRMIDTPLVIQDFVNALNIRKGTKVGQPGYGTTIWDFVFEPNVLATQQALEAEIARVAGLDPRIELNYIKAYTSDNGILMEVQMSVTPFNDPLTLTVLFDVDTKTASIQSTQIEATPIE